MADPTSEKQNIEEVVKPSEKKSDDKGQQALSEVTIPAEKYNALIDRMAELEEQSASRKEKEDRLDIDDLADEVRRSPRTQAQAPVQAQQPPVDLENLSNTQLAAYITSYVVGEVKKEVNEVAMHVLTETQTVKMLREIDKCEESHKDFWDYEKDIFKLAGDNPQLSIEEAYLIAAGRNPKPKEDDKKGEEDKGETKLTSTQKLFGLPPKVSVGEKPGRVAAGSTRQNKVMSLDEAARSAAAEVFKER